MYPAIGLPDIRLELMLDDLTAAAVDAAFFAGWGAGAGLLGGQTDSLGRKKALLYSLYGVCICGVASALAPTAALLGIGRFGSGLAIGGLVVAAFTHLIESSPVANRPSVTLWLMLSASLAVALLAPLAYALRGHWRLLPLASAAPAALMVFCAGEPFIWVEESPVWLLATEKEVVGCPKELMLRIGAVNGLQPEQVTALTRRLATPDASPRRLALGAGSKQGQDLHRNQISLDIPKRLRVLTGLWRKRKGGRRAGSCAVTALRWSA